MGKLKLGKYQHYKGKFYEVMDITRHSETTEEFVFYKVLSDSREFKNVPLQMGSKKMFLERIVIDGEEVAKFKYVGDIEDVGGIEDETTIN